MKPYLQEAIWKCQQSGIGVMPEVVDAMEKVDRKLFVPSHEKKRAEMDHAVPILSGQTTSAPHMILMMLCAATIRKGEKVLEVGTGSGYNTAILSILVGNEGKVVSIERIRDLIDFAKQNLSKIKLPNNYEIVFGDGTEGLKEQKFDKIIVTAAGPFIPAPLCWQLKDGGIMIIPVQDGYFQTLLKVRRLNSGEMNRGAYEKYLEANVKYPSIEIEELMAVQFVKLVGKHGFES